MGAWRPAGAGLAGALAFLSRFALPRTAAAMPGPNAPGLDRALAWFGPAGLVLGCIWTLPALALPGLFAWGDGAGCPQWPQALLAGWIWLFLSVWTTFGLHWDGTADLGDAEGSGATGERFREILADSRLGAFGALRLLLVFGGEWCAVSWHAARVFAADDPMAGAALALPLALAPAWGRGAAVLLAHMGPPRKGPGLGALACAAARPGIRALYRMAGLAACAGLVMLGLPPLRAGLLLMAQILLLRRLTGLARREGGLSGDFFGAAIEEGTLCFLLFTL
ncbi:MULTISPECIES: adenosylcobinamide-GDP ribazoletransferase [unclassified Desulfovibrio]|uniref:adenosylcobinamide-GDP ribazoletransferase n=1 Tax=unclassified Desulfovibrio TaxID=2593640 RepID=UPI0013E9FA5F|nr:MULTISPECIES: adenosylcobinamide-GDP ribazoletransferase [unclassified Desulfovibrio]